VSPKLPQVSGATVVGLLRKLGYSVVRQRGSHVQLAKSTPFGEHRITVPAHKTIAKGTLGDILTRVSLWNSVSKEDLLRML